MSNFLLLVLLNSEGGGGGEYVPDQWYITERISTSMKELLWQDLNIAIPDLDAAQLDAVSRGPLQDDPQGVYIEIFENDLIRPIEWAHGPDALMSAPPGRVMTFPGGRIGGHMPHARETVGGDARSFEYQRAVTLRLSVWLDQMPLVIASGQERFVLDRLSGVVAGRTRVSLMDGGPGIGGGQSIEDSFGEYVVYGPFFGKEWIERQTGESHISSRYIQVWYRTTIEGG